MLLERRLWICGAEAGGEEDFVLNYIVCIGVSTKTCSSLSCSFLIGTALVGMAAKVLQQYRCLSSCC